jgi:hypothetical protein
MGPDAQSFRKSGVQLYPRGPARRPHPLSSASSPPSTVGQSASYFASIFAQYPALLAAERPSRPRMRGPNLACGERKTDD